MAFIEGGGEKKKKKKKGSLNIEFLVAYTPVKKSRSLEQDYEMISVFLKHLLSQMIVCFFFFFKNTLYITLHMRLFYENDTLKICKFPLSQFPLQLKVNFMGVCIHAELFFFFLIN